MAMWTKSADEHLSRLFASLTEQTFIATLGVTDTRLVDYVSAMLARFVHSDDLYRLHDEAGRPIHELVDMVSEARRLPPEGRTAREYHRHIGDFALFWTGLFPESLERKRTSLCRDVLVDYCSQGKRSYFVASTFQTEPFEEESKVLRRLSEKFEMCAYGLNQVRREWEHAVGGLH